MALRTIRLQGDDSTCKGQQTGRKNDTTYS